MGDQVSYSSHRNPPRKLTNCTVFPGRDLFCALASASASVIACGQLPACDSFTARRRESRLRVEKEEGRRARACFETKRSGNRGATQVSSDSHVRLPEIAPEYFEVQFLGGNFQTNEKLFS